MKKLFTILLTFLALSALADRPFASDMAIYKENGITLYFYAQWHNIEMLHSYQLQYSDDATNWVSDQIAINTCCPLNIWVQESPLGTNSHRLFRMIQWW